MFLCLVYKQSHTNTTSFNYFFWRNFMKLVLMLIFYFNICFSFLLVAFGYIYMGTYPNRKRFWVSLWIYEWGEWILQTCLCTWGGKYTFNNLTFLIYILRLYMRQVIIIIFIWLWITEHYQYSDVISSRFF